MKIKDIELANISRYRGELMGAAMLFVILFHVGLPREDTFFGLRRMGNIGVDIFLFLSGMGLWFSWTKHPSLSHFFTRRFLRIYPTWLLLASLYYIPDYLELSFVQHSGHSVSIIDLIGDISINWDVLVYPCNHAPLPVESILHEAHPHAPHLPMVACCDVDVVHISTICNTD